MYLKSSRVVLVAKVGGRLLLAARTGSEKWSKTLFGRENHDAWPAAGLRQFPIRGQWQFASGGLVLYRTISPTKGLQKVSDYSIGMDSSSDSTQKKNAQLKNGTGFRIVVKKSAESSKTRTHLHS